MVGSDGSGRDDNERNAARAHKGPANTGAHVGRVWPLRRGGGFPTNTYNAGNYWVDIAFQEGS